MYWAIETRWKDCLVDIFPPRVAYHAVVLAYPCLINNLALRIYSFMLMQEKVYLQNAFHYFSTIFPSIYSMVFLRQLVPL